ncbi:hypothetical protein HDV05_001779 [Chytridiales sp. JEL 0842]|nr:hypothetical protein HDV05_001779 [Chytridiales sp. JEL 0842]
MKFQAIFALVTIAISSASAGLIRERRGCGAPELSVQEQLATEAHFQKTLQVVNAQRNSKGAQLQDIGAEVEGDAAAKPIVIPTYFHVIYKDSGIENGELSDADVKAQVDVMNKSYNGTFVFELVEITKTQNVDWFESAGPDSTQQAEMKAALRRGGPETLNVYSVGFEKGSGAGLLGYATFPISYKDAPSDDGVVYLWSSSPGGSTPNYDLGATMTHEVGHWLGLFHTFQGGCSEERGDFVSDTPAERSPASGCPTGRDSCPSLAGLDPIENYMDYSFDACMDRFSPGQYKRMLDQWVAYRDPNRPTDPTTTTTVVAPTTTTVVVPTTTTTVVVPTTTTTVVVPTTTTVPPTTVAPTTTTVVVPTPSPAPVSNIGCYSDSPRLFVRNGLQPPNGRQLPGTSYNLETCMAGCLKASPKHKYFGLEFGGECFCGFYLPTFAAADADASKCNMDCKVPSVAGEKCGGRLRMTLYQKA